jgi:betaine reductase
MRTKKLIVVHYLNQFFSGIGGEDMAHMGPQVVEGATGPGRALQATLGERGDVVATVSCGDNYFAERMDEATDELIRLIRPYQPDALIAGPAFDAGRYGVACGAVCRGVKDNLNIPTVTGMYPENPGVDLFHKDVYIIQTGNSVRTMNEAITRMVNLAIKLAEEQEIGKPLEEGYIPRGIIVNKTAGETGAERVVAMLLHKLRGEPYESEVSSPKYDRVKPAPRIEDIGRATIALVTDGGLVPKGNPDKIESSGATRFGKYSFTGSNALNSEDFDVNHAGYDTIFIRQDPNRLVPVDVMRGLEKEGAIGRLYESFHSTTGVATAVENARRIGQAIATELKSEGVSGVILTST